MDAQGREPDQSVQPGRHCDFCGRAARDEVDLLSWTTSVEHQRRQQYCTECSRTHLRAIEGKLDTEYW